MTNTVEMESFEERCPTIASLINLNAIQSRNREAMEAPADEPKAPEGITLAWEWIYTITMIHTADAPEEATAECFGAVIEYLAFGIEPLEFADANAESVFESLKPALDKERERLEGIEEKEAA